MDQVFVLLCLCKAVIFIVNIAIIVILGTFLAGEIICLDDLVEKIKHYENYFHASCGGVTLSGGEPLLQPKFVLSLLKELKKAHIHVAIDTSRYNRFNRYYKRNYKSN